jgi:hypothetical protein
MGNRIHGAIAGVVKCALLEGLRVMMLGVIARCTESSVPLLAVLCNHEAELL